MLVLNVKTVFLCKTVFWGLQIGVIFFFLFIFSIQPLLLAQYMSFNLLIFMYFGDYPKNDFCHGGPIFTQTRSSELNHQTVDSCT